MSGLLVLAQISTSLWTSSHAGPGNTGIIVAGIAVLAIILFTVIKNRGSRSPRSPSSVATASGKQVFGGAYFNKAAFRRAARAAGLLEEEVRALESYGKALGVSNPDFVFRNPQKLDAFFKAAYGQIEKASNSEADTDERKAILFSAREHLTRERAQGGGVKSTRQLGRGSPLTFIAPGKESYPSVIIEVEPRGLAVEPVTDTYGETIRFRRGTRLACFFYARGHAGYQFATQVIGWEKNGIKDAMILAHNDAVSALPARRHARRAMKAPCTFYRVAVMASKVKGQKKSAARVENLPFQGTIVDISAGGSCIQCPNPLSKGEFIKIAFNSGGGAQAAFAKVIRTNAIAGQGGDMHVQFVKISRQGLNAILSYVYGYVQ